MTDTWPDFRVSYSLPQTSTMPSCTGILVLPFRTHPSLGKLPSAYIFLWTLHLQSPCSSLQYSLPLFKKQIFKAWTTSQNAFIHITGHAFKEITRGHFYRSKCVSCSQQHGPITVMFLFQKASLLYQQQPFKAQCCHMVPLLYAG